jgi:O-antigen/teichoic acid export membrane protein
VVTSRVVTVQATVLARNTLLNMLGEGLPLIVALITMPMIVRGLGAARFGILALAWVVLSSFGAFDLGMGRATTRFVAEALGNGKREAVRSIAWTAVLIQLLLGTLGGLVLAGATPVLVGRILTIPPALVAEARTGFWLLALSLPVVLISGTVRGLLEAAQRFDVVNAIKAPFSSANFLVPMVGLQLGWGIPGIVGLLVVARTLALVFLVLACLKVFPELKRPPSVALTEARSLFRFGGWIMVSTVVAPLLVYADRFMIGALLSVSAVTYYSAPYEMVTRLWIFPASLVATLFPAFTWLSTGGSAERLEAFVVRSVRFLLVVLGPLVVVAATFAHDALRLWLGPQFAEQSAPVVRILALGVLVNSLAQVPYSLLQAVGRPDLTATFHLVELPLHIALVWILVTAWGISGAALAWAVRSAVDGVLLFAAASRVCGISPRILLARPMRHAVTVLVLFALFQIALGQLVTSEWLRLAGLVVSLPATAAALWRWSLDAADRSRIVTVLLPARLQ